MPWILKHKRSTQPMVAEYLCPVHGRFELTVERDVNGDPPAQAFCPTTCGRASPFAISNPGYAKVRAVEAVRGGYEKPAFETWTDTTALGEGQDLDDWHDDRAKVWERHREAEVHKLTKEL